MSVGTLGLGASGSRAGFGTAMPFGPLAQRPGSHADGGAGMDSDQAPSGFIARAVGAVRRPFGGLWRGDQAIAHLAVAQSTSDEVAERASDALDDVSDAANSNNQNPTPAQQAKKRIPIPEPGTIEIPQHIRDQGYEAMNTYQTLVLLAHIVHWHSDECDVESSPGMLGRALTWMIQRKTQGKKEDSGLFQIYNPMHRVLGYAGLKGIDPGDPANFDKVLKTFTDLYPEEGLTKDNDPLLGIAQAMVEAQLSYMKGRAKSLLLNKVYIDKLSLAFASVSTLFAFSSTTIVAILPHVLDAMGVGAVDIPDNTADIPVDADIPNDADAAAENAAGDMVHGASTYAAGACAILSHLTAGLKGYVKKMHRTLQTGMLGISATTASAIETARERAMTLPKAPEEGRTRRFVGDAIRSLEDEIKEFARNYQCHSATTLANTDTESVVEAAAARWDMTSGEGCELPLAATHMLLTTTYGHVVRGHVSASSSKDSYSTLDQLVDALKFITQVFGVAGAYGFLGPAGPYIYSTAQSIFSSAATLVEAFRETSSSKIYVLDRVLERRISLEASMYESASGNYAGMDWAQRTYAYGRALAKIRQVYTEQANKINAADVEIALDTQPADLQDMDFAAAREGIVRAAQGAAGTVTDVARRAGQAITPVSGSDSDTGDGRHGGGQQGHQDDRPTQDPPSPPEPETPAPADIPEPTPVEPEAITLSPYDQGDFMGVVTVKAKTLNVRSGPEGGSEVVGKIYKGSRVMAYGEQGTWYKVDFDGQEAWVSAVDSYTSLTSSDEIDGHLRSVYDSLEALETVTEEEARFVQRVMQVTGPEVEKDREVLMKILAKALGVPEEQLRLPEDASSDIVKPHARQMAVLRSAIADSPEGMRPLYWSLLRRVNAPRNQCDNSSRETEHSHGGVEGRSAADVMCNITCLAMALTYLGVEIPAVDQAIIDRFNLDEDQDGFELRQVEDRLEALLVAAQADGEVTTRRTAVVALDHLAEKFNADSKVVHWENLRTAKQWKALKEKQLDQGKTIVISLGGHYVNVIDIMFDDDGTFMGVLVNDPFGISFLVPRRAKGGKGYSWTVRNDRTDGEGFGGWVFYPDPTKTTMRSAVAFFNKADEGPASTTA